MPFQKFEELIASQKSQLLAIDTYQTFYKNRDYSFFDQIKRAVVSISNNIAERFGRKGDKENSYFLCVAISSCSEVRSMIHLAFKLNYINEKEKELLMKKCIKISKIIKGLIESLKNNLATLSF